MEKKAMTTKVAEMLMTDAKDILLMLGISTEFNYEKNGNVVFFESQSIPMSPRIFKELRIKGRVRYTNTYYMDRLPKVILELEYKYYMFGGGSNGTNIGHIEYIVEDEIEKIAENYSVQTLHSMGIFTRIGINLGNC